MRADVPAGGIGEFTAPEGFASFSTVETLLRGLTGRLGGLPDDLRAEHEQSLAQTVPAMIGAEASANGHFYNADRVGSAVVRRISRESIHLSDAIDGVARLVPELVDRLERTHGPVTLKVSHAERMDRPSVRVLYRMMQLAARPLRWEWRFAAPVFLGDLPEPGDFFARRFVRSRQRLFTFLADKLDPVIDGLPTGEPYLPGTLPAGSAVDRAVADELVGQNYDRAYLRAREITRENDPETIANVYRMLCIVDANVGEIDSAAECLERALHTATSTWLRAHCHYMTGLLLTKRRYDLDAADEQYRLGLELLGDATDDESKLERAWLVNGRSLVRALRSKALPDDERDQTVKRIFTEEAEAYRAVLDQDSAQALYLQLNLLANMTLLLEINQDHERAAFFWSQVFNRFRGLGSEEQRTFEVAFRYRLGMLLAKAGRHEEARTHLAEAVAVSDPDQRRFTYQRTLYALGYVQYRGGQHADALATFARSAVLAAELRDTSALLSSCLGARTAAHDPAEVSYWDSAVDRVAAGRKELAETAAKGVMPTPPPKFPSYIPLIDLEATPIIDLNSYLANDRSRRGLAEVVQERLERA